MSANQSYDLYMEPDLALRFDFMRIQRESAQSGGLNSNRDYRKPNHEGVVWDAIVDPETEIERDESL